MKKETKITNQIGVKQFGKIKVHTQILADLSSGIYSSPASCLKELINNSYDAEATEVVIRLLPLQDNITVVDNGNGMNAEDFDRNFAWISKSNKRNTGELSPNLKRPLIGKIGIGFIAINEICDVLEISSSKAGESTKFTAVINFKKYFDDSKSEERDSTDEQKAGIIKAEYELINDIEDLEEHYTTLNLTGLKEGVKVIFEGKQYFSTVVGEKNKKKNYEQNFFGSMQELMQHHFTQKLKSFDEDNEYVKFILDLASYITVEYLPAGPIPGKRKNLIIDDIVKNIQALEFKVDFDGIYLKKPIFFPQEGNEVPTYLSFKEEITTVSGESIKLKGFFYIHHGIIFPVELNGIAVRVKGIPIAPHYGFDRSFLNYPNYLNQIFRNWISGDIYIEKGLESAMNIDRASFRLTHEHFLAFQDFLHRFLNEKVFPIALELYESAKNARDKEKEKSNARGKQQILKSKNVNISLVEKKSSTKTAPPPVSIKKTGNSVAVEVNKKFSKSFTKKDWTFLEDVFLIFEMAFKESGGDLHRLRNLFYDKITEWKAKIK